MANMTQLPFLVLSYIPLLCPSVLRSMIIKQVQSEIHVAYDYNGAGSDSSEGCRLSTGNIQMI